MPLWKYRHYKWQEYEVIGSAKHSETLEDLVVYRALYTSDEFPEGQIRVRPKEMFLGNVTIDGKVLKRFSYIGK